MPKKSRSVSLRDDQIEEIQEIEEGHPVLKGAGFSAILRWLIDIALGVVHKGEGEEDADET